MLHSYKIKDPPVKQEQPLFPSMLQFIRKKASSSRDKFISHLLTGTFFFAMRSCEYVLTSGKLRSKIITSDYILFYKSFNNCIKSTPSTDTTASSVQIHFEMQKNLEQDESVSNQKLGQDLCSVFSWQQIVNFLEKSFAKKSIISVNNYLNKPIKQADLSSWIKRVAINERKWNSNINSRSYGIHSARCGATLAMYISGTSVVDIILQGCQSSDAFLLYIKRAILEQLNGISKKMLENDSFTILPPRHDNSILHRSNNSLSYGSFNSSLFITSPSFYLYHQGAATTYNIIRVIWT